MVREANKEDPHRGRFSMRIAKERTGQIPGPADKTTFFNNKMQDDELAIANV